MACYGRKQAMKARELIACMVDDRRRMDGLPARRARLAVVDLGAGSKSSTHHCQRIQRLVLTAGNSKFMGIVFPDTCDAWASISLKWFRYLSIFSNDGTSGEASNQGKWEDNRMTMRSALRVENKPQSPNPSNVYHNVTTLLYMHVCQHSLSVGIKSS